MLDFPPEKVMHMKHVKDTQAVRKTRQRTPTKPRAEQDEDALVILPQPTDKEYAFINAILSGKNQSDAYREAYDAENMSPSSIWCAASKLRSSAKVSQWLEFLRTNGAEDITVTRETHLRELERIKEMALMTGNFGAAAQCEQLKGKATGLYTERVEMVGGDSDLATIQASLEQEWGREIAMAMMAKKGLPWVASELTH
jgi:phage terminase small subunit